jgi:putative FmdB family regulatory protein
VPEVAVRPARISPRKPALFSFSAVPTYEYRCPEGHTFELMQRMSDPPVSECQICGASPVHKVLYPAALHFKGSGFYSTEYGRGGRKRDAVAKDGDSPSVETKKSDEKPVEKAKDSQVKDP